MTPTFSSLTFFIVWAAGVSQSVLITQWPQYISSLPSGSAQINCYQNDTDYPYHYWYQQIRGERFQLMLYTVAGAPTYEEAFKSGFEAETQGNKKWSLIISSVQEKDEAVYLCAASLHSAAADFSVNNYDPAYFGTGTKLTVLDPEKTVTPPTVKVLRPSAKECRNQKDEGQTKKTIVCVASGFYPDHVSVRWKDGAGTEFLSGVATDSAALEGGDGFYTITSRLRVLGEVWFNPENEFTCIVSFFNGTHTEEYPKTIHGDKGKVMTREKYLRRTQTAKLSYGVLIVKSCIYGAFVVFLVWKLKGSSRKQR
ncbi:M1-specific T cell receptor beta chain [Centropristis striata]|uniref:M1-specific T cell receptor beta chain n=1 Tax=Centropristis striata TaxID=184440 RepID=UPI0027DEB386|nr:M1-specific T cell receptor beta chain [Centropristis striata]